MAGYLMKNELDNMWKQAVVTRLKHNPVFTLRTEKNHKRLQPAAS
jgi:hypothetical protein